MKRAELFHPRVFSDREWARGYHERNARHIERVGRRFAGILEGSGFTQGRVLDAGCGFGAVAIEVARRFPRAEVVGVDLGRPLLELGRSLAEDAGVADRIDFREGDVQALDHETGSCAVVISTFMLHVVEGSAIRPGRYARGPFWWDFMAGVQVPAPPDEGPARERGSR